MEPSPLILIGGVDPTTHAGLFADARVLSTLKLPYRCIATAITAQSDQKFYSWDAVAIDTFRDSLVSLGRSITGVKIGMIGKLSHAKVLTAWLKTVKPQHVVWDPVLHASSGGALLQAKTWNQNLQELMAQCSVLTPNLDEARWILGNPISKKNDMEAIAQGLYEMSSGIRPRLLLKGGHARKKSDSQSVDDMLIDERGLKRFSHPQLPGNRRGTGCTLATALLAYLSRGSSLRQAYPKAYRLMIKLLWP